MRIISHRGYWKRVEEKNQKVAFERSFSLGFGTETDLRDLDGQVVISHDMPKKIEGLLSFSEMLSIYLSCRSSENLPLLLNIKSDGLQGPVKATLKENGVDNYFLFDMSVPDLIVSVREGLKCLTRQSDIELEPNYYDKVAGVWMDEFVDEWITEDALRSHVEASKTIYIVSPELHKRPHIERWQQFKAMDPEVTSKCCLCTDLPEDAVEFFAN